MVEEENLSHYPKLDRRTMGLHEKLQKNNTFEKQEVSTKTRKWLE
jgi:hypothetical protein